MKKTKSCTVLLMFCLFALNGLQAQVVPSHQLKALLIVGHVEDRTPFFVSDMDKIAAIFRENHIAVHKFYDKEADWDKIVQVAPECSFLVYAGHGMEMGKNGKTGGLCIKTNVSTEKLLAGLRLQKNALVIFKSVCRGAGSSAGDLGDIGMPEAQDRVTNYAYPFLDLGASGYFASNMDGGAEQFLRDFLSGTTFRDGYLKSTGMWNKVELDEPFKGYQDHFISIATSPGGEEGTLTTYKNGVKKVEKFVSPKTYNIAAVGKPDFDINDVILKK